MFKYFLSFVFFMCATTHAEEAVFDHEVAAAQKAYEAARFNFGVNLAAADHNLGLLSQMDFDAKMYGNTLQGYAEEALKPLAELIAENKRYHLAALGTGVMATLPGVTFATANSTTALADITAAYSYASSFVVPYVQNVANAKNLRNSVIALFRGINVPTYPQAAGWV